MSFPWSRMLVPSQRCDACVKTLSRSSRTRIQYHRPQQHHHHHQKQTSAAGCFPSHSNMPDSKMPLCRDARWTRHRHVQQPQRHRRTLFPTCADLVRTIRLEEQDRGRETQSWLGKFTSDVKQAFGRGGEFHDPYKNVLTSTSSFMPTVHSSRQSSLRQIEALVFPSFQHVRTSLKDNDGDGTRNVIQSCLVSENRNRRVPADFQVNPINAPTILVCTHATRDSRCGVLGPILLLEFANVLSQYHHLQQAGLEFSPQSTTFTPDKTTGSSIGNSEKHVVNLGAISHVGGHKWAGNVILYIPPSYRMGSSGPVNPLSGMGVWYGRVQPQHVHGIVEETLVNGRVIKDLFRGGIDATGQPLRM